MSNQAYFDRLDVGLTIFSAHESFAKSSELIFENWRKKTYFASAHFPDLRLAAWLIDGQLLAKPASYIDSPIEFVVVIRLSGLNVLVPGKCGAFGIFRKRWVPS